MTIKWQTNDKKWHRNDKEMTKKMTKNDNTNPKWQTQMQKNDKIIILEFSNVCRPKIFLIVAYSQTRIAWLFSWVYPPLKMCSCAVEHGFGCQQPLFCLTQLACAGVGLVRSMERDKAQRSSQSKEPEAAGENGAGLKKMVVLIFDPTFCNVLEILKCERFLDLHSVIFCNLVHFGIFWVGTPPGSFRQAAAKSVAKPKEPDAQKLEIHEDLRIMVWRDTWRHPWSF